MRRIAVLILALSFLTVAALGIGGGTSHEVDEFGFSCYDPFDGFNYCTGEFPSFEEPPLNETNITEPPPPPLPVEEPEPTPDPTPEPEPVVEETPPPVEETPVETEPDLTPPPGMMLDPYCLIDPNDPFCLISPFIPIDPCITDPTLCMEPFPFEEPASAEDIAAEIVALQDEDEADEPAETAAPIIINVGTPVAPAANTTAPPATPDSSGASALFYAITGGGGGGLLLGIGLIIRYRKEIKSYLKWGEKDKGEGDDES